ncbi:MAG: helix-turn-helix transcriptional regulator [Clostridiales bacterium]|nr:helix-turn-helix transcriptional regulator [Clostridiales bacterium]
MRNFIVNEKQILDKAHENFISNIPDIDMIAMKMQALSETVSISERYGDNLESEHMEWISNGEVEKCKASFCNDFTKLIMQGGIYANSVLKHVEYAAVMQCVIYTNAAINGGVSARTAWAIREFFLRKIDKAVSINEYYSICYELLITCVEMVKELKVTPVKNIYVKKAKAIITSNLEKTVSVSQVAKQLGITSDYLCRVFKSNEGITVKQYLSEQRLKTAARLLQSTDYPVIEICQLCGFSSQGYFAKLFKKILWRQSLEIQKTMR